MTPNNETSREGAGIRAGRARKQRMWMMYAAGIAALVIIKLLLISTIRHAPAGGPPLPPLIAGAFAVLLVLILLGGVWMHLRLCDELDYQDNLVAFSVGFLFSMSVYIVWFMLFLGGMAQRPAADMIFLSSAAAAGLVYGWMKLRRMA